MERNSKRKEVTKIDEQTCKKLQELDEQQQKTRDRVIAILHVLCHNIPFLYRPKTPYFPKVLPLSSLTYCKRPNTLT